MDFDRIARALYGLPASEFTAERDARVKIAKADGDKELAARLKGLKRPTAVAWVANQLVRQQSGELEPLLALGSEMRAATARRQGAELRTLSARRQKLLQALVRQATVLAEEAGQPMNAGTLRALDDTLRAAVADPDLAEQLRRGRLTDGLTPVDVFGAGGFDLIEPPEPAGAPVVDLRARQLARATAAAGAAAQKLASARSALADATDAQAAAEEREAELRTQLAAATKQREALQDRKIKAERAAELAGATAQEAAAALTALEDA